MVQTDHAAPRKLPPVALLIAMQGVVAAASLVVEIVAGRMLAPYVGMSLYTWTSVIAMVLAGFSGGHWLGGRFAEAPASRALILTGWSMAAAALATGGAVFLLRWAAGPVIGALESPISAIAALTALVFFLPSFFAGVPAPVLAQIAVNAAPQRSGRALGAIFAAGAVGAIAGTLLAGFVFISRIGSAGTLAAVTLVYALLAMALFVAAARAGRATPMALALLAALLPLALAGAGFIRPNPCTRESDYFCIRVLDVSASPDSPVNVMVLDHLAHGASARDAPGVMFTDHAAMLDALTRARMPSKRFSAFFIGGGSYSIPRAWAALAPAPEVTVAEIDPAVTEVAIADFWFDPAAARILHEDARRALAAREDRYDVVIGDAFTDIAVPQHLVTEEFFRLVASRLRDDGVYLMNVIDHMDRLDALASIIRTLRAVFPVVEVWVERRPTGPDERMIFVVLAGATPTAQSVFSTKAPGPFEFARLSARWTERTLARREAVLLTDDYAPIDRLMRWTY
jgi:predicted membrane-bound spermidine synthase